MEISVEQTFGVPVDVLFDVFTDQHMWLRLGLGAAATVEGREGGRFELFGGGISGTFESIDKPRRITQKWRFSEWADGVFSNVEISFCDEGQGNSSVTITQRDIPEVDKYGNGNCSRRCEEGWREIVFDRIEKVLGYPKRR